MKLCLMENLKRLSVAALVLMCSVGASAGKGGKASGSISLSTDLGSEQMTFMVDGEPATVLPEGYPRYGDTIKFDVVLSGVSESEADSSLSCFQAGRTVYFNRDDPQHIYVLSDEADPGWKWDGGSANCRAVLVYCPTKGKDRGTCQALDTLEFDVAGSTAE